VKRETERKKGGGKPEKISLDSDDDDDHRPPKDATSSSKEEYSEDTDDETSVDDDDYTRQVEGHIAVDEDPDTSDDEGPKEYTGRAVSADITKEDENMLVDLFEKEINRRGLDPDNMTAEQIDEIDRIAHKKLFEKRPELKERIPPRRDSPAKPIVRPEDKIGNDRMLAIRFNIHTIVNQILSAKTPEDKASALSNLDDQFEVIDKYLLQSTRKGKSVHKLNILSSEEKLKIDQIISGKNEGEQINILMELLRRARGYSKIHYITMKLYTLLKLNK